MRPTSVRLNSSTVAMSRSPCGATTVTPLACVTSMSMLVLGFGWCSLLGALGGRSPALAVLDQGPAGAALSGDVDREAVGNALDQVEPVAAVGQGLEIGALVLIGIERLAEVFGLRS